MYALMYPILYIASIHCYIPLSTAASMSVCSVCIVLWHDHVNGEIKALKKIMAWDIQTAYLNLKGWSFIPREIIWWVMRQWSDTSIYITRGSGMNLLLLVPFEADLSN